MAKDANDVPVAGNDVLVLRDGTLWVFQSAHTAFEMNLLGYCFPAKIDRYGTIKTTADKPNIIRMYDTFKLGVSLGANINRSLAAYDKRAWQAWWKQEWIRIGGNKRLRETIYEQRQRVRQLIDRSRAGAQ